VFHEEITPFHEETTPVYGEITPVNGEITPVNGRLFLHDSNFSIIIYYMAQTL